MVTDQSLEPTRLINTPESKTTGHFEFIFIIFSCLVCLSVCVSVWVERVSLWMQMGGH